MTPDQFVMLSKEHVELLLQLERLWTAMIILVFLGLLFLVTVIIAAAWSVRTVNKRQGFLEAKFTLLIDVLLAKAHTDIEAKKTHGSS